MSVTKADAYSRSVSGLQGVAIDERSKQRSDLAALVLATLGYHLDAPTFEALANVQWRLQTYQSDLAKDLETKKLTPEDYLDKTNSATRDEMTRIRAILGDLRYFIIFGDEEKYADDLIDRDTFLATRRSGN